MATVENRVVIVTGASSGIGLALSRSLVHRGAKVVMAARSIEVLKEIEQELTSMDREVLAVACDVTKSEDCENLVKQTVAHFGGIDICICNAGVSMRGLFDDVELSVLHTLMDVNFWGAVNCVKYALPYIQKSHGTIIGIDSIAGMHGLPGRSGYSASKFALAGFLETVRIENIKKSVHVMLVYPGFTASNIRKKSLNAKGVSQKETPRDEQKMISAEDVSRIIIRGIERKKRDLRIGFIAKATRIFKFFVPCLLDKIFYSQMKKEPNSPLI